MRSRPLLMVATIVVVASALVWAWPAPVVLPLSEVPATVAADRGAADRDGGAADPRAAVAPGGSGDAAAGALPTLMARREVASEPETMSAAATALLAAAPGDRKLYSVTAEVRSLGPVETVPTAADRLMHQEVRLRLLAGEFGSDLRRYATVSAPLCPATSEARFGCSTPFGVLAVGQVRTFVLARGRPDFGALGTLLGELAFWIVLAGPEVARPDDPILAAVPEALAAHLGVPRTSVFRGRVREFRRRPAGVATAQPLASPDLLVVDVTLVAAQGAVQPLRDRVRIGQAPFTPGIDLEGITVGGEYWFATDDATWWQVVLAWAPAR